MNQIQSLLIQALTSKNGPLAGKRIKGIQEVSGGCINQAWRIDMDGDKRFFAKTNRPDAISMFKCESDGLFALNRYVDKNLLVIPKPIEVRQEESFSMLLMPWLSLIGENQSSLGKGLARMHKLSAQSGDCHLFGWDRDGYIGSGLQPGGWRDKWGECFFELRLLPQLNIAKSWGLSIQPFQKISSFLVDFLNKHNPEPSIVHGDLWSGNAFSQGDCKGVLIDPAVWWADREVDIAMTRMFGGFTKDFYKAYEFEWPLKPETANRIDIYNLYHLLNHANIFGGSYKQQCQISMDKIVQMLLNFN